MSRIGLMAGTTGSKSAKRLSIGSLPQSLIAVEVISVNLDVFYQIVKLFKLTSRLNKGQRPCLFVRKCRTTLCRIGTSSKSLGRTLVQSIGGIVLRWNNQMAKHVAKHRSGSARVEQGPAKMETFRRNLSIERNTHHASSRIGEFLQNRQGF